MQNAADGHRYRARMRTLARTYRHSIEALIAMMISLVDGRQSDDDVSVLISSRKRYHTWRSDAPQRYASYAFITLPSRRIGLTCRGRSTRGDECGLHYFDGYELFKISI